ncbi:amidohydrolase 2 [Rhizobium leguminosarum bv. trifolii]|uniref:amidohydrolase family protein n=1 Tax=Rhizobium leguminosarum TaxID=384 RepID=UPI000E2ECD44|nr:amidohydrolase family protein [Rhizobium leguminosarum]RFB87065.1 amidohydrolase 2 [Rhizobium leguminosarum bv. trifolii]
MTKNKAEWIEPIPDAEWLALYEEDVIDPDLPIIDSHHHLWTLANQSYLRQDFMADVETGHNVQATIYMEASMGYDPADLSPLASISEIDFALEGRSDSHGICRGIVSYVNLRDGNDVEGIVERHRERAMDSLCGIRDTVSWSEWPELRNHRINPDRDALRSETFRMGAAAVGRAGLALDLWLYQDQLPDFATVAKNVPGTKFVLDHCGGPLMVGPYANHKPERFVAWQEGIAELRDLDNVFIKLGGLGMRTVDLGLHRRDRPASSQDLADAWRPFVSTCVDAVGPSRCMFESNFPVDKEVASYRTLMNAFKRLSAPYSDGERRKLLSGTAAAVYGIDTAA